MIKVMQLHECTYTDGREGSVIHLNYLFRSNTLIVMWIIGDVSFYYVKNILCILYVPGPTEK